MSILAICVITVYYNRDIPPNFLGLLIFCVEREFIEALTWSRISHRMTAPSSSASVTGRKRRAKESSLIPAAKRKRK